MGFETLASTPDVGVLKTQIIPIRADDIMAEAGRKILLADFIRMLEYEPGCRTGEDIESVHDMRVTTRRMRSLFKLLDNYYKTKAVRPHIEQLKSLARRLGAVRDLDVMIFNLGTYQSTLNVIDKASLQPIINHLDKRRTKARKKLNTFLDSPAYRLFLQDFAEFLTLPGMGAKSVDTNSASPHQVRHVLPAIIYEHMATVRAYDTVLHHANTRLLHSLRIEFKQLRYIVSYFSEVLGASIEGFIGDLKEIQDYLGRLNDVVVAQTHLKFLLDDLDIEGEYLHHLENYIASLAEEESQRVDGFSEIWAKFNSRSVQRKLSDSLLVLR